MESSSRCSNNAVARARGRASRHTSQMVISSTSVCSRRTAAKKSSRETRSTRVSSAASTIEPTRTSAASVAVSRSNRRRNDRLERHESTARRGHSGRARGASPTRVNVPESTASSGSSTSITDTALRARRGHRGREPAVRLVFTRTSDRRHHHAPMRPRALHVRNGRVPGRCRRAVTMRLARSTASYDPSEGGT